ncbi:MAG: metallophosphoesterase [Candidatus Alcyoniella australis]|nr:metallophosphoesterase [Candidatus Alcyoniella australis]
MATSKHTISTAILCLALIVGLTAPAAADSLSSIAGWPYGTVDAEGLGYSDALAVDQEWPIFPRIGEMIYPVLGMPAITEPGGELTVLMAAHFADRLLDPDSWRGYITTRESDPYNEEEKVGDAVAQTYPLSIESVDYLEDWGVYQLGCRVNGGAPADAYSVRVSTVFFADKQLNALHVVREISPDLTFAHITDVHIDDPRGASGGRMLNSADFPGYTEDDKQLVSAIVGQQISELNLLKPAFVLLSGDLVYGLDYVEEYGNAYDLLKNTQVPIFMVPGNHDGMASMVRQADWQYDGLDYFRRTFGPPYYSFDYGPLHVVGLNTYDGSRERRNSLPLPPLASPVDNYGGFMTQPQLDWLYADLEANDVEGRQTIVFGHHDMRGPYSPNTKFPAKPLGLTNDEWNYDSEVWDSDPADPISNETPEVNTGVLALKAFVDHGVSHVFLGHVHSDWVDVFEPGDELIDYEGRSTGIATQGPMRWVHTTTACSSIYTDMDYWGYRLIDVEGGILRDVDFSAENSLQSLPAGNVWTLPLTYNDGTTNVVEVLANNSLFQPVTINLEFYMRGDGTGYRVYDLFTQTQLPIVDLGLGDEGETVIYARAALPAACEAAQFPPQPWQGGLHTIVAAPDTDNAPPLASIAVERVDHKRGLFVVSAEDSFDPDQDDRIVRYDWFISSERFSGDRLTFHAPGQGYYIVQLIVMDEHGAQSQSQTTIKLEYDEDEEEEGCGCQTAKNGPTSATLIFVLLGMLFLLVARRRA